MNMCKHFSFVKKGKKKKERELISLYWNNIQLACQESTPVARRSDRNPIPQIMGVIMLKHPRVTYREPGGRTRYAVEFIKS